MKSKHNNSNPDNNKNNPQSDLDKLFIKKTTKSQSEYDAKQVADVIRRLLKE